ncbi:MAG: undecaprenyl-diphosphatase [Burkholderiaceae bacterium]|nr:MAG: undecaprenyl-diphosphatase [Burkholderiaceae bacterium]
MEEFNQSLFLLINAPAHPAAAVLVLARLFAQYLILLMPLTLLAGWLRGSEHTRKLMLEAAACALLALLMAQIIGMLWPHPRPFMIGLGHQLIPHVADPSFPSDHLTLMWSVGFSLLLHAQTRAAGALLTLLGLPVAWARIYLGVHFPLDMVGAALVAALSAWLCLHYAGWVVEPVFPWMAATYRRLFASLIRWGWVVE